MESAKDDLDKMDTMTEVFKWAGFDHTKIADVNHVIGLFTSLLGVAETTKPVTLGVVKETDFDAIVAKWKIPDGGAARSPTLTEVGMAKLVGHICRLIASAGESLESLKRKAHAPATPAATPPVSSTAATRKVKLSAIISQIDDTEIMIDDEKEVMKAFLRYEAVCGKGDRPPSGTEPTNEQLSAMRHLLNAGCCPYADFSIFGPYGQRMYKTLKLSGYIISRDGNLATVEMHGPNNVANWISCYTVLQNMLWTSGTC